MRQPRLSKAQPRSALAVAEPCDQPPASVIHLKILFSILISNGLAVNRYVAANPFCPPIIGKGEPLPQ